jgi:hypothetical protein
LDLYRPTLNSYKICDIYIFNVKFHLTLLGSLDIEDADGWAYSVDGTPTSKNFLQQQSKVCQTEQYTSYPTKVKQSRNRPGVAQRVTGGSGSQISMTFGT